MPIAVAFIGLVTGHLLELLLDRFYSDAPPREPLVRCQACRSSIRFLHLLPLVGYLWHRGRCPDCDQLLPIRVLLLPPASALVFALAALTSDEWGPAILGGLFAAVFLALMATDLERRLIPNRIVYPAMLLAIALSRVWPDRGIGETLAGGGLAFAIMLLVFIVSLGRFGFGDVKMATLMGFAAGFPAMVVGLFFTAISAGLVAAVLLVTGIVRRGQYIPYGPFIAIGSIISLFWGDAIIDWYTD
jgi:prepilin signal peptidase PulO-like enzyme (type II secretory pathway)